MFDIEKTMAIITLQYRQIYKLIVVLALLVTIVPITSPVQAQETNPNVPSDDEVNQIASDMYCPVCENIPLDTCGTQACEQWRELIREKLADGWSEAQIKDYFVLQYGDRVLATPPARGFNWLVYVVPPMIFFAGAGILFIAFRRMRQTREPVDDAVEAPSGVQAENEDEYLAQLEEQMRQGL